MPPPLPRPTRPTLSSVRALSMEPGSGRRRGPPRARAGDARPREWEPPDEGGVAAPSSVPDWAPPREDWAPPPAVPEWTDPEPSPPPRPLPTEPPSPDAPPVFPPRREEPPPEVPPEEPEPETV